MKNPSHHWQDMTAADFNPDDVKRWIAVLPVAAVEQHGPHLPLSADALIGQGLVQAVCERLPAGLPVTFLPLQTIGKSDEHIASPGTLTLSWDTLTKTWLEIGASVYRAGVRKLVLINAHGGNVPVMDIVARELRIKHKMLCVATNWMRLGLPEDVFSDEERAYGIHGGDVETSLLLYLQPHLVRMDKAQNFRSNQADFVQEFKHLRAVGPAQFGWQTQDLNPHGVVGNAAAATAEKGRAVVAYQAERFVELLEDMHGFDLARLWKGG